MPDIYLHNGLLLIKINISVLWKKQREEGPRVPTHFRSSKRANIKTIVEYSTWRATSLV